MLDNAISNTWNIDALRYLIEHKADVAAVNNDGELPIDIAETEAMEELLDKETQDRGLRTCQNILKKIQNMLPINSRGYIRRFRNNAYQISNQMKYI